MKSTRLKILVTDGDNRAALAITRSLGRHHEVTVCAAVHRSLASVSRWCADSFAYPDPVHDASGFLDVITTEAHQRHIDVVLPVSDITTILLAENRDRLAQSCQLPVPAAETIKLAADKVAIMKLAQELDVPIPTSLVAANREQALAQGAKLPYPVVIKPARSRVRVADSWVSSSVQHAANKGQLARIIEEMPNELFPVLLQERIYGDGVGMFLHYQRDHAVAAFCHRRLREKPPSGGISVLRESIPIDENARAAAERLLGRLGWNGVAMVEFKRDNRDGLPKLMEINGRFWGSLQLAIDAGMDFPSLLVNTIGNLSPTTPPTYRVGVKSRWFWGDLDALLAILLKPRERAKLPPQRRSRLAALADFLRPHGPNCHLEVLRIDDIKPWLHETWRWVTRR